MVLRAIVLDEITKGKVYTEKRRGTETEPCGVRKNQYKRLRMNSQ